MPEAHTRAVRRHPALQHETYTDSGRKFGKQPDRVEAGVVLLFFCYAAALSGVIKANQ
jgi:hypothetical protein